MSAPGCPRCAGAVMLHEGHPSVTSEGHVALWHRDCWKLRDVPLPSAEPTAPTVPAASARRFALPPALVSALSSGLSAAGSLSYAGLKAAGSVAYSVAIAGRRWRFTAGLAAAAAAVVAFSASGLASAAGDKVLVVADDAPPSLAFESQEPLVIRGAMPGLEDPPPRSDHHWRPIQSTDEVPLLDGTPLDDVYPTLKSWIHPVTASSEYMPVDSPRLFGAERIGVERAECGAGHCGVDLDGPRGRPIVAVAAGILVNVERRELGGDGRSGRYVRILHEDGTLTAYMHMDDVADGLQPGVAVARGQYVGTLGATATYSSPPHLHFSLEIPRSKEQRGDYSATRYVNPAPFLMRSTIAPVIERPNRPALN